MTRLVVEIPVSVGDLIDRIAILELKRDRLSDPAKRAYVETELALLTARRDAVLAPCPDLAALAQESAAVNRRLWDLEEDLRAMERAQDFGPDFIAKARAVYATNDTRARIKTRIDALTGSALSEQKSYL